MFKVGVIVFYTAVLFNFIETWHFGWNRQPLTPEEAICDYISLVGMMAGIFMVAKALIDKKYHQQIHNVEKMYFMTPVEFTQKEAEEEQG